MSHKVEIKPERIYYLKKSGYKIWETCKELGISRDVYYKRLKEHEEKLRRERDPYEKTN